MRNEEIKKAAYDAAPDSARHAKRSARNSVTQSAPVAAKKVAALEFVERFGVSLSSGYRHVSKGTVPAIERLRGVDGKSYPTKRGGRILSDVERCLRASFRALTRAAINADSVDGLCVEEREQLSRIAQLAARMLSRCGGAK